MLFLFDLIFLSFIHNTTFSCQINGSNKVNIYTNSTRDPNDIAYGIWSDSLNQTGWYQFHVTGNSSFPSKQIARCAGAIEGYSHSGRISQHFKLIQDMNFDNTTDNQSIHDFLQTNLNFIRSSIISFPDSIYWTKIGILFSQFEGMVEGLSQAHSNLSELDLWLLQSQGDLEDLTELPFKRDHCSGLVRLLDDFSDLFMSHDSWSDYRDLHGELKEYNLNIKEFKSKSITLSTRIGKISSYDDFYINDQGLFILETTIGNFNEDLYKYIIPQNVFTWLRASLATWDSDSGKEWTEISQDTTPEHTTISTSLLIQKTFHRNLQLTYYGYLSNYQGQS